MNEREGRGDVGGPKVSPAGQPTVSGRISMIWAGTGRLLRVAHQLFDWKTISRPDPRRQARACQCTI